MSDHSEQGWPAGTAAAQAQDTGNADVDAALVRLADLETLPTAEHVGVFEDVHRRLQQALPEPEGG